MPVGIWPEITIHSAICIAGSLCQDFSIRVQHIDRGTRDNLAAAVERILRLEAGISFAVKHVKPGLQPGQIQFGLQIGTCIRYQVAVTSLTYWDKTDLQGL